MNDDFKEELKDAYARIEQLERGLQVAAKELELLYFFAISNGIAEAGVPPHVDALAILENRS